MPSILEEAKAKAKAAAEAAKARASAAAANAKDRLSDSGLRESLESARTSIEAVAASSVDAVKTSMEADRMDVLLREKNRRILELEESQVKLNSQLKKALFGDALGEANALAKQREAELDNLKQRTVSKFQELVKEKEQLLERVRLLEREAAATTATAPPSAVAPVAAPTASPAGGARADSPGLFASPNATNQGCATPLTAGNSDAAGPSSPTSSEAQQLAAAAAELTKAKETIAQKDSQLSDLRAKGRDMLGRLKVENAELQRRLQETTKGFEQAEEMNTATLSRATAADERAATAEQRARTAERQLAEAEEQVARARERADAAEAHMASAEVKEADAKAIAEDALTRAQIAEGKAQQAHLAHVAAAPSTSSAPSSSDCFPSTNTSTSSASSAVSGGERVGISAGTPSPGASVAVQLRKEMEALQGRLITTLQAEYYCDDITPPAAAFGWTCRQMESFFESGGSEMPADGSTSALAAPSENHGSEEVDARVIAAEAKVTAAEAKVTAAEQQAAALHKQASDAEVKLSAAEERASAAEERASAAEAKFASAMETANQRASASQEALEAAQQHRAAAEDRLAAAVQAQQEAALATSVSEKAAAVSKQVAVEAESKAESLRQQLDELSDALVAAKLKAAEAEAYRNATAGEHAPEASALGASSRVALTPQKAPPVVLKSPVVKIKTTAPATARADSDGAASGGEQGDGEGDAEGAGAGEPNMRPTPLDGDDAQHEGGDAGAMANGPSAAGSSENHAGGALVLSSASRKSEVRKLTAAKERLQSEVGATRKEVAELKAALGVLTQANEQLEAKLQKEKEKTTKSKEVTKVAQAEAKDALKLWNAERKRLQAAAAEAGKRAEQSQRNLAKAQEALAASEATNRARLETGELPQPPTGADDSTVAMAALNQELVNAKLRFAEVEAERSQLRSEVKRLQQQQQLLLQQLQQLQQLPRPSKVGAPAPSAAVAPAAAMGVPPATEPAADDTSGPTEPNAADGPSESLTEGAVTVAVGRHVTAAPDEQQALVAEAGVEDAETEMARALHTTQQQLAEAKEKAVREASGREELVRARGGLEVQLAEAMEKTNRANEALGVLTKEHDALEAKLAREREKNAKAKEVVLRQQAERKLLYKDKEEAEAQLVKAASECVHLRKQCEDLQGLCERTRADAKEKKDQLTNEKRERFAAATELDKLKKQLQAAIVRGEQLEQMAHRARSEEEDGSAALGALRTKVGALESELAAAQSEVMQKDLQLMSLDPSAMSALSAERDGLAAEVASLRAQAAQQSADLAKSNTAREQEKESWGKQRSEMERLLADASRRATQAQAQAAATRLSAVVSPVVPPGTPATPQIGMVSALPKAPSPGSPSQIAAARAEAEVFKQKAIEAQREALEQTQQVTGLMKEIKTLRSKLEEAKKASENATPSASALPLPPPPPQPLPATAQTGLSLNANADRARAERAAAEARAAAASAEAVSLTDRLAVLQGQADTLEATKAQLEAQIAELTRAAAESEELRREKASRLKEKTQAYVTHLQETHRATLEEATTRATAGESRAREALEELEQTQAAAAASISDLRAQLGMVQRTASLQALEAAAVERSRGEAACASLWREIAALEHRVSGADGGGTAAPGVTSGTASSVAVLASSVTRPRSGASGGEDVELALVHAQAAHADQLAKTAAAMEAEAEARSLLQLSEHRHGKEQEESQSQIAALRRELETLARISAGPQGRSEAMAVVPEALAQLPADQMRRELAAQYGVLREMGEALDRAEARVEELEQQQDLAALAERRGAGRH